jgi:hypothetical protein
MHTAAYARSEQIGKLIGRVRKACRRPRLLHHPGRFVAHKALNHGPTEWTDVVDTGAAVARIPNHPRLGGERTLANDLDKELFVASKREVSGGVTPRPDQAVALIVRSASTAVEMGR